MFPRLIILSCLIAAFAATSSGAELSLTETVRIGGGDEDPDYLFGTISFVVVGPIESVIVADQQITRIRKYSADGTYISDIGREGGGPGEYYGIRGMIALPNNHIAVLSNPAQISLFDGDTGQHLDTFQAPTSYHGPGMLTHDDAGFIYVRTLSESPHPLEEWPLAWLKISSAGEVVDTIEIPAQDFDSEPVIRIVPDGIRMSFPNTTESAWCPGGYFVVGRNDRYEIEIRRPEGSVWIRREIEPVRVAKGEREEWERVAASVTVRTGMEYSIPKKKPFFRELRVDSYGRIWVHLYAQAVARVGLDEEGQEYTVWREPNCYDVFDSNGTFIGAVVMPLGTRAMAWSESAVWGVQEAENGEQLVRWEVEGLVGSN